MEKLLLKNRIIRIAFTMLAIILMAACQQEEDTSTTGEETAEESQDNTTEEISFTDSMDRKVVLDGQPQRIVALAPKFLKLIYDLDGEAVGRMSTSGTPVSEKVEDLPELLTVNHPLPQSLHPNKRQHG